MNETSYKYPVAFAVVQVFSVISCCYVFYFVCIRWLAVRLEIMSAVVVLGAALFSVQARDSITGAIVGLSVTYALKVCTVLLSFDNSFVQVK